MKTSIEPKYVSENSRSTDIEVAAPPAQDKFEEVDFGWEVFGLVTFFWSKRRVMARIIAGIVVLSVILSLVIPKTYTSTTSLMPPEPRQGFDLSMLANLGMPVAGLGAGLLGQRNTGALFVGIVGSRTVQDRLIDRFDLGKVYGLKKREAIERRLAASTAVSEDQKTGIVTISVTAREPDEAARLARAYVEELDRVVYQSSTSAARRERMFLEERLKAVKQDLDESAKALSQFSSKNATIDIQLQGKAMLDAAMRLKGELVAAQAELAGLRQIYSDENVRVRAVRAKIRDLENEQLKISGQANAGTSANGPGVASSSDRFEYPSLRELPVLGVTYADLYRRTQIQETVYEILTKQYELAKVQEAKEIPSVRVLDQASVPQQKSGPQRTIIVLLGFLLSVIVASVYVLVENTWNRIDSADPRKRFVLEVLSSVTSRWSNLRPKFARLRFGRRAHDASTASNNTR